MGVLRLLLALIVVAAHTMQEVSLPCIGGNLAVQLFFVVSGFYMALILSEKYHQPSGIKFRLFYSNRALRIFPLLWLVLGFELLLALLVPWCTGSSWARWPELLACLWQNGRVPAVGLLAFCQMTGFGVDLIHLVSFDAGGVARFYDGPVVAGGFRGWQPLPMSHVWSISCELAFYVLAPWVVRMRLPTLLGVGFVSALLAPILVKLAGLHALGSVAASFAAPCQLVYFVVGVLAYRLYCHARWSPAMLPCFMKMVFVAAFSLGCFFYAPLNQVSYTGALAWLYMSAFLVIPVLFAWTQSTAWDRKIGELSYPVYLLHISVIRLLDLPSMKAFLGESFQGGFAHMITVAALSTILAWVIVIAMDRRIDAFRQSRISIAFHAK